MLRDRYDNPLSTTSGAARDHYVRGLDLLLGGDAGVEAALEAAIAEDDGFAMAHLALARAKQGLGKATELRAPLAHARALAGGVTAQEAAAIDALGPLLEGRGAVAYPLIRAHVAAYPRDALLAQTCMGVFGLIGFSGQPGREAEQLAYAASLAPHYGEDWWFLCQYAFAQLEVGQFEAAGHNIDRALAQRPSAAHAVHVKSHLLYEVGETEVGIGFLKDYQAGLDRTAQMHCHLSWHLALWALEVGDEGTMWRMLDAHIAPEVSVGPPLNILTDAAALLARAEMRGITVPEGYWHRVSAYASERFPKPGIAFADIHAALAHAMAGQGEALTQIIREARGPAADLVAGFAEGFGAFARADWAGAVRALAVGMADHARLGGSRAQRDLVEMAMAAALMRLGQGDEARRFLLTRRPVTTAGFVPG